jgi:hypothetical protein
MRLQLRPVKSDIDKHRDTYWIKMILMASVALDFHQYMDSPLSKI